MNPEGRPAAGGLDAVEEDEGGDGTVIVEVEGLESRVTPFPVTASKYSALYPVAGGGLVWLRWPIPARWARPSRTRTTPAAAPPWSTSASARRRSPNSSSTWTGSR
ncbi:hypothetical protein SALBM311S_11001 [Streptomyces alboniger]